MSNKPKCWAPNDIRAEMVRQGIKMSDIARQAGVSPGAVRQAILQNTRYKGYRIRPYIAAALGVPEEEIWPLPHPHGDKATA